MTAIGSGPECKEDAMGLVKTRRLAAMQKQQRAKAGLKSRPPKVTRPLAPSTRYHRIYINAVVNC